MTRATLLLLFGPAGLLSGGCAAITASRTDMLTVNSNPQGAEVRLDGAPVARTPASIAVDRKRPPMIEVALPGFQSRLCPIRMTAGGGYIAADIVLCVLLCPIGCISFIDAGGDWNVLDPPTCYVTFAPGGPPAGWPPPPPPPPAPTNEPAE
jgi:PEGA domain-containing protein